MPAIDPREFRPIASNNELIQEQIAQICDFEKLQLSQILKVKEKIEENKKLFFFERQKLEKLRLNFQKVNDEYWRRGAGWNIEHLKVLKNKLKKEFIELEYLLIAPNQELEVLHTKLEIASSLQPNLEVYEFYKLNFETFKKEINHFSIFTLSEADIETVFLLAPDWVSKMINYGDRTYGDRTIVSEASALGQSCYKRRLGEEFEYHDSDGEIRKFKVVQTQLISTKELDLLNGKINIGFVINPEKPQHNSLDLNSLGHLAAPVPLGGGGERRFNQLRPY